MAAAIIYKKKRPPTLATAFNFFVLFRTVDELHFYFYFKNFFAQYKPQRFIVERAVKKSGC